MEVGSPPPQSTVMQMMMAAWTAQTIATVARLGVADVLHDHGPLTARELTERHRVNARPDLLERALRACASVGVFTEGADGRFGPTPLSGVLVDGAPVVVQPVPGREEAAAAQTRHAQVMGLDCRRGVP